MERIEFLDFARNTLSKADPEKLIGYGRLITIVFAIVAMHLDPTQPARFRAEAQLVLAAYASAAVLLMIFPLNKAVNSKFHLPVHVLDAGVLGWLAFLSDELISPFFSFLPFTLLAMTIRWGFVGALGGVAILETILLVIGIPDVLDGESELNILIMRTAYFLVAAIMLAHFGAYRETNQLRLERLANWQNSSLPKDKEKWIDNLCVHASQVMGSGFIVIAWRDQDRSNCHLVARRAGRTDHVVLHDVDLYDRVENAVAMNLSAGVGRSTSVDENLALAGLVAPQFRPHLSDKSQGYIASFSPIGSRGLIWAVDPDCRREDAILLIEIIATQIGSDMERSELTDRLSLSIRSQERNRLARDLHDSVLQDMTATSIKLRTLANSETSGRQQLSDIEQIVTRAQRRIRHFVEDQKSPVMDYVASSGTAMQDLVEELTRKWGIEISFRWNGTWSTHFGSLWADIRQLMSEATSNAVRHGHASKLRISVAEDDRNITLEVADNGSGLDPDLAPEGSQSLRSRVSSMGGIMELTTCKRGLTVSITIPTEEAAE